MSEGNNLPPIAKEFAEWASGLGKDESAGGAEESKTNLPGRTGGESIVARHPVTFDTLWASSLKPTSPAAKDKTENVILSNRALMCGILNFLLDRPAGRMSPADIYMRYRKQIWETTLDFAKYPLEQEGGHLAQQQIAASLNALVQSVAGAYLIDHSALYPPGSEWTDAELGDWCVIVRSVTGYDVLTGEPFDCDQACDYLISHHFSPSSKLANSNAYDVMPVEAKKSWLSMVYSGRELAVMALNLAKARRETQILLSPSATRSYRPFSYVSAPTFQCYQTREALTLMPDAPCYMWHNDRKIIDLIFESLEASVVITQLDRSVNTAIGNLWKKGIYAFSAADVARVMDGKGAGEKISKTRQDEIRASIEKQMVSRITITSEHLQQRARKDKSIDEQTTQYLDALAKKVKLINIPMLTLAYYVHYNTFGNECKVYSIPRTSPPYPFAFALATGYTREIPRSILKAGGGELGKTTKTATGMKVKTTQKTTAYRQSILSALFGLLVSKPAKIAQKRKDRLFSVNVETVFEASGLVPQNMPRHKVSQLMDEIPTTMAKALREEGLIDIGERVKRDPEIFSSCTLTRRDDCKGRQSRWKQEKVVFLLPEPKINQPKKRRSTKEKSISGEA